MNFATFLHEDVSTVHVETSTATENGNNIVHQSREFNQRQVLFLGIKVSFLGSCFENSHEEACRDLFMPGICSHRDRHSRELYTCCQRYA